MAGDELRLFTAVRVPRRQLERLHEAVAELGSLGGARWVPLENQHVTLNFLGWVAAGSLPEVVAAADSVAESAAPARVSIEGLGAFPDERRARVLWAGIVDPDGLLPRLARGLGEALRPLGHEPEDRAYTPHLTLARLETPRPLPRPLPALPDPPGTFDVDRVTLFRSRLSTAGARYEVLHEAYLTGGRGARGRSH